MATYAELLQRGIVKDVAASTYTCRRVSIEEVANKSITILDIVQNIKTEKGDGRTLVHFTNTDTDEAKFFTNARILKEQLASIPQDYYPVTATVVKWRDGNKTLYKLQ